MDAYGCKYGFICTYNKIILAKRVDMFRFRLSEVVRGDQDAGPQALRLRECLYFLARQAASSDWKYDGRQGGEELVCVLSFDIYEGLS